MTSLPSLPAVHQGAPPASLLEARVQQLAAVLRELLRRDVAAAAFFRAKDLL